MQKTLHVSPTSGDYSTISAALCSIPSNNTIPVTILIAPGIYREKLTIDKPHVSLLGLGKESSDTVITYDDYALALMENGEKRGTFRSYSVFIDTHDVTLKHLTIENASGDSKSHGQAIALYADGDRFIMEDCRLLGHQDTLFTGPLPPKELQPGGFIGPKQFAPRINGRHYYKNCYICGDIDFIFGSATAYFENCTIESLCRLPKNASEDTIQGYTTAASTPEGQEYGYVFFHCRFTTDCCPKASVYLGRPWRDYAKTVLLHCELGSHIHPAGFHDWNKKQAHDTIFYAEYQSIPLNETTRSYCENEPSLYQNRASFCTQLDTLEAEHFSKEKVLAGSDGWNPN